MAEVILHLEYVRSVSEDSAALARSGRVLNWEAAHDLVADFVRRRCGNEDVSFRGMHREAGDDYAVAVAVTFAVDGDTDLGLYETAVEQLLPKDDSGLDADGCSVLAVVIDGTLHGREDIEAFVRTVGL